MTGDRRRLWIGIAAILVIAFLLVALPSGSSIVMLVQNSLQALFLVLIGFAMVRAYRTQGDWLAALSERDRGIVYGAIAIGALAIVAIDRFRSLWNGGVVLVVLILAGCAGAIYWVWRESRRWMI